MSHCKFEPKIQVECIVDVIKIVREGQLLPKRAEVLQHVGCVLGSFGAYLDGGDSPSVFTGTVEACNIEECCDMIEAELESVADGAYGVNPLLIILIQQLIKLLLDRVL